MSPTLPRPLNDVAAPRAELDDWSYDEAFSRNRGLISLSSQQKLRTSRVAIAGMGGVGALHLMTLARLGVGKFTIADPDCYEVANFNRQYGANLSTLGRNKAEAMAEAARGVNPDVDLRVLPFAVDPSNVDDFLAGADVYVDGVDFFALGARRILFREAAARGLWSVTAGPIGFSAAWLAFDPAGMSFDEYFDLRDDMEVVDQLVAFAVGLTPRATHLAYTDLSQVNLSSGAGPSASLACQLATGVLAAEVLKVLTDPSSVRAAPHYHQFDAWRCKLRSGVLRRGNRSFLQRLKRHLLKRRLTQLGLC